MSYYWVLSEKCDIVLQLHSTVSFDSKFFCCKNNFNICVAGIVYVWYWENISFLLNCCINIPVLTRARIRLWGSVLNIWDEDSTEPKLWHPYHNFGKCICMITHSLLTLITSHRCLSQPCLFSLAASNHVCNIFVLNLSSQSVL